MEPFRPLVDRVVYEEKPAELTTERKQRPPWTAGIAAGSESC